jgi:hypothetical protein
MTSLTIRQKLHSFIDTIEDKKAAAIYTLLSDEIDAVAQRKKLVMAEWQRYFAGEGKLYSWEEVKNMATDKNKRRGL